MSVSTVTAVRRAYARAAREVWDRCYELTVTALEDAPADLDLASEALCESVTEVEGAAHALLALVADLPDVVTWPNVSLVEADAAFSRWREAFDVQLATTRARVEPDRRSTPSRGPDHGGWLGVVDTAIALAGESGRRFERARLALWRELVETDASHPLHTTPTSEFVPSPPDVRVASSSEEAPA